MHNEIKYRKKTLKTMLSINFKLLNKNKLMLVKSVQTSSFFHEKRIVHQLVLFFCVFFLNYFYYDNGIFVPIIQLKGNLIQIMHIFIFKKKKQIQNDK